jgi:hypothetical protein
VNSARVVRRFDDHDKVETIIKIRRVQDVPHNRRIHCLNLFGQFGFVVGWIESIVGQRPGGSSILAVKVPELALRVGG